MRSLLVALLYLCAVESFAQGWQWSKQIGGPGRDNAQIFAAGSDGNVYMFGNYARPWFSELYSDCYLGSDTLFGSDDSFIARFDSDGALVWATSINSPMSSVHIGAAVIDTAGLAIYCLTNYTGNCMLDTCSVSAMSAAVALSKWTLEGHCLWARNIATSLYFEGSAVSGYGLVVDETGNVIVSMGTDDYGTTMAGTQSMASGCFIARYNPDGQPSWVKSFCNFSGNQKWVNIYTLKYQNGKVIAHGPAYIPSIQDTTTVDSIQIFGRQGHGQVLASIDPTTGIAEWLRLDGFPNAAGGTQMMAVQSDGSIYCASSYYDSAIFGDDTLETADSWSNALLAKYDQQGIIQDVWEYSGSGSFGFQHMNLGPDGSVLVAGLLQGQISFGGITYSGSTIGDLFIASLSAAGEPITLAQAGNANAFSVVASGNDACVSAEFSNSYPWGTITVGNETFTTHGWEDIVLAKYGSITGVPPAMQLENTGLEIFANPNQGNFRLKVPSALANEAQLQLRIYDGTGRLVSEQQLLMDDERPRLDVWDVSPGFYMVTLSNGKRTYSGNMVVE